MTRPICCAALLLVLPACLSDLRPPALREAAPGAAARARGVELLRSVTDAAGGLEHWRAQETVRYTAVDDWPGLLFRTFGMPWPENDSELRITARLGTDDLRLEVVGQDEVWGIQDWITYRVQNGAVLPRYDGDAWFWLPTLEYFFELPFRIGEATEIVAVEPETVDGVEYDRVLASWGTLAPQLHTDQYLVWIRRSDHRIEWAQYTVRDVAGFVTGTMHYEDFRRVGGIDVPFRMTVGPGPGQTGTPLHIVTLKEVEFGVDAPPGFFEPMPGANAPKH